MKDIEYYRQFEPIDGKWRITRRIGEGAYGQVFEIQRIDAGDNTAYKAALKAITIPTSDTELAERRAELMDERSVTNYYRRYITEMQNELRIMSELKGKTNIVSYEDHLIHEHPDGIGADILIRMELLKPLNQHIQESGFTEKEVIRLGVDICTALEICKKKNLIHRDIKPGNIFLSDTDDFKLGDFGIARIVDSAFSDYTSAIGTESYMSPEVYLRRPYGPSVDLYSLGMVLYHLTNSNRGPFLQPGYSAADRSEALQLRMRGEPLPQPEHCSDELWQIIRRACAFDPRDRFADPTEMKNALNAIAPRATDLRVLLPYRKANPQAAAPEARTAGGPGSPVSAAWPSERTLGGGPESAEPVSTPVQAPPPVTEPPIVPPPEEDEDNETMAGTLPPENEDTIGKMPKLLRVRFLDGEQELSSRDYRKGESVAVPPAPERAEEDGRRFVFVGWKPEVEATAARSVDYRAVFREEKAAVPIPAGPSAKKKLPWKLIAVIAAAVVALAVLAVALLSASNKPARPAANPSPTLQETTPTQPEEPPPAITEPEEPEEPEEPAEPERGLPIELVWEDNWSDHLPEGIDGENSALEVRLMYRSVPIECMVNNPEPGDNYVALPELSKTEYSDFGPYSEWSETPVAKDEFTDVQVSSKTVQVPRQTTDYSKILWSGWVNTKPSPGSYIDLKETGSAYSAKQYMYSYYGTKTVYDSQQVTIYRYAKRTLIRYDYFYDKTKWSDFDTTPITPTDELYVSTRMQYRYVPVENGVFAEPSMDNFAVFTADYRGRFADVPANAWYAPEKTDILRTVCEYSFLLPDMHMYFRPGDKVTLGQAIRSAVMIYRVYNGCSALLCENTGKYDAYLDYAVEHGLMQRGELTELDREVTRQELAYLFCNALPAEELADLTGAERITDMDMSYKYYDCALALARANVIRLKDDGSFRPMDTATRAEMASMIDRLIYPAHRSDAD